MPCLLNSRSEPDTFMPDRVAAFIMNWNGRKWLELCLPSIVNQDYPNLKIIVIDCNSQDGSADWVEANYSKVHVHRILYDCAPPHANNLCAREYDADWICILNNDVVLPLDCISNMVQRGRNSMLDSVINPIQLTWDGKFRSIGCEDPLFGSTLSRIFPWQGTSPFYPCTACCLVRRDTLFRFPLNEDLFIYEDIEWGWRIFAAGGQMIACDQTFFYHYMGGTFQGLSRKQAYTTGRNIISTIWICAPNILLLLLVPVIFLYYITVGIWCIMKDSYPFEFYRGFLSYFKFLCFQVQSCIICMDLDVPTLLPDRSFNNILLCVLWYFLYFKELL